MDVQESHIEFEYARVQSISSLGSWHERDLIRPILAYQVLRGYLFAGSRGVVSHA